MLGDHRNRRVGHRDGTRVAGFYLRIEHERGGAHDGCPGPGLSERPGVGAVGHCRADDAVVGRVVLDLIELAAIAVVRLQHRLDPVGAHRIALEGGRADAMPDVVQPRRGTWPAVGLDALAQGDVRLVLIQPRACGRLVRDLVCFHPTPSSVAPR